MQMNDKSSPVSVSDDGETEATLVENEGHSIQTAAAPMNHKLL